MSGIALTSLDGHTATSPTSTIDDLAGKLGGDILTPDHPRYDEARAVWNRMIDRKPAIILRCRSTQDISQAVRFAAAQGVLTAVRGGGHNIAGNAVCDGGVVIDLSEMRSVAVDPVARTATVAAGATLGDLDQATQAYGLATPVGINSTTGVAGLTLGGGFGWISRRYGLAIDNLISVEVVAADGSVLTASAKENPDLFWGIRGGGGNFGVVSSFQFRLHPVGPEVMAGLVVHPFSEARSLLQFYRGFAAQLPDEVAVWIVMRQAPPLPFLPTEWHGKRIVVFAACCAGDMAEGEAALKPLREHGKPLADVISPHSFLAWQATFDPLLGPGFRNYWKTNNFDDLGDHVIDELIRAVEDLPSPHSEIAIAQVGGAISRVDPGATAYRDRNVNYIMNVHGRWETAAEDENGIAWTRSLYAATIPDATGGAYVNFLTAEESGRVQSAYGPSYERLVDLKTTLDPNNLFRVNQNIKPRPPS